MKKVRGRKERMKKMHNGLARDKEGKGRRIIIISQEAKKKNGRRRRMDGCPK